MATTITTPSKGLITPRWVVISGLISPLIGDITVDTLRITTHEPPSHIATLRMRTALFGQGGRFVL